MSSRLYYAQYEAILSIEACDKQVIQFSLEKHALNQKYNHY